MGACFHCGCKLFGLLLCFTDCCVVLALLNYISPVGSRPVPVSALLNGVCSLVPSCGGGKGGRERKSTLYTLFVHVLICQGIPWRPHLYVYVHTLVTS